MIPIKEETKKIRSSVTTSTTFDIADDMKAHVFRILREGIYTDAPLACIREYTCNAIDANVEAGKSAKDVEIVLPNRLDSYFIVKDVGVGLDEEQVDKIFRFYGASTKRESNELIGQLGIGSKAAFSYVDNFSVIARKNGVERVFICAVNRNSDDEDGKGSIYKVSEKETTESNGVTIKILVDRNDIGNFIEKALFFMSFFPEDNRPQISGISEDELKNRMPIRATEYKGKNWGVTYKNGNTSYAYCVMGCVPYRVDPNKLTTFRQPILDDNGKVKVDEFGRPLTNEIKFNDSEVSLARMGVDLQVGIGEVDIAVSREELRYTSRTLLVLKRALASAVDEINAIFQQKINNSKTLWDARYFFYRIKKDWNSVEKGLYNNVVKNTGNIVWKGIKVEDNTLLPPHPISDKNPYEGFEAQLCTGHGSNVHRMRSHNVIVEQETVNIVIEDKCYGMMQRLVTIIKTMPRFYLVSFATDEIRDKWLKVNQLEHAKIKKLSDFERDATCSVDTKKHRDKTFVYSPDKGGRYSSSYWSSAEIDFDELNEKLYYVEIFKFVPRIAVGDDYKELTLSIIDEIKKALETEGIKIPDIYGFKKELVDKAVAHPKCVNLLDYFVEVGKKIINNKQMVQAVLDKAEYEQNHYKAQVFSDDVLVGLRKKLPADHALLKLRDAVDFLQKQTELVKKSSGFLGRYDRLMAQLGHTDNGTTGKPTHSIVELQENIEKTYPMLKLLGKEAFKYSQWGYYGNTKERVQMAVDYVILTDERNSEKAN